MAPGRDHLYIYVLPEMVVGWGRLPTVKAYLHQLVNDEFRVLQPGVLGDDVGAVCGLLDRAMEMCRHKGWKGDFRPGHDPRIVVLPFGSTPALAVLWQQENDGLTFVVSEVPMVWLSEPPEQSVVRLTDIKQMAGDAA